MSETIKPELFEDVDTGGGVKLPPPTLGALRNEYRGEQGALQPGLFGADAVEATGTRYQPRLDEFLS